MANKFDTNPLDPEFPEKTRTAVAAAETVNFPKNDFTTGRFAPPSVTEEETRRFSGADLNGFGYGAQTQPAGLYPSNIASMNRADGHKIAKIGVSEKLLIGLPYVPFYIGLVAGLVLLLIVPKQETKVRFHAAQGLAAHVGILIVTTILGIVGGITDLAELGSLIFTLVATIMLVCFAIKAWQGKPVHIESVDELTNWLDEKIGPVKF